MSALPATDWNKILNALGEDRRLLIQGGDAPGTVEVRVEDRDRNGFRASYLVSREAIDHAAFNMIDYAVDNCMKKFSAAPR